MRVTIAALALGIALAGCSKKDTAGTNTATPAAATNTSAGFAPPTSISRLDFGSRAERRFHKLDKNNDDKLTQDELPANRAARMLKRMDTNGDGSIDATEWGKAMLARFDKQDVNKDGNLTSDERGERGGRRGKRRAGAITDSSGDAVDNDL